MFLAATQTGTLSSTDSRNWVVDASLRESLRCSVQSSWVATEPPFGSRKYLTRTDLSSASSVTSPSGVAADAGPADAALVSRHTRASAGTEPLPPACQFLPAIVHPRIIGAECLASRVWIG